MCIKLNLRILLMVCSNECRIFAVIVIFVLFIFLIILSVVIIYGMEGIIIRESIRRKKR